MKGIDKNWVLLLMSLLAGGLAAWGIGYYIEEKENELALQYSKDDVVYMDVIVANKPMLKGDTISPRDFTVRKIPAEYVSHEALAPSQFKMADGQMLLEPISPGKPLLSTYLPGRGAEQFSHLLAEGQRAVTLEMNDANSNAGMMVAGDKIDIFLMYEDNSSTKDQQLRLIIENVTVLATGKITIDHPPELVQRMFDDPTMYNTITVGVDLFDAGRVNLAKQQGSFVALLRNRKDKMAVSKKSIYASDIFLEKNIERTVEFIIGGGSSDGMLKGIQQKQIIKLRQSLSDQLTTAQQ